MQIVLELDSCKQRANMLNLWHWTVSINCSGVYLAIVDQSSA